MFFFYDRSAGKFFISKLETGHDFSTSPFVTCVFWGLQVSKFPWSSPVFSGEKTQQIGLSKEDGCTVCMN